MGVRDNSVQYKKMAETPIYKLVPALAVPSTITMLITSLYNMADTFFVSQLGVSATGAVGVVFSLMAIIQAIGFMLGMGSNSLVSRHLGANEQEKADITASVGFFSALTIGAVLMVAGSVFRTELVYLLGASETIARDAEQYATYILYAAPLMCATFQMNNVLRGEGKAALGTFAMTTGGLLNIALDPVFIFLLDMGISGAAIATALSQSVSFCILLSIYLSGRSSIQIRVSHLRGHMHVLAQIISVGFPSLCRQGLASLASVFLNRAIRPYGDAAIAAMSIVSRVTHFQGCVVRGLGQGCQPVIGYNFGAKKYRRVYDTLRFTAVSSTIFMLVISVVMFICAPEMISLFRKSDAQVLEIGVVALRINCIVAPLGGLFTAVNMAQQSSGKSSRATLLSSCRQGFFFLPLIAVLPMRFGLIGAQTAQPVADVLTFLLAIYFYRQMKREMLAAAEQTGDPGASA